MVRRESWPGSAGGAPRWPLAPLLALQARQEERDLEELGRALAAASSAEEDAARRRRALAMPGAQAPAHGTRCAAEVARGERFLGTLQGGLSEALRRAKRARAAAVEARVRYARSRGAREGLEAERERWRVRRRLAREAAAEREIDDLVVVARAPSRREGSRPAGARRSASEGAA